MMKLILILGLLVCISAQGDAVRAHCRFRGVGSGNVQGYVQFYQDMSNKMTLMVSAKAVNVPEGEHGFHIHAVGDLGNRCANAAGHYNPNMVNHGAPSDSVRHAGDLGNVRSTAEDKLDLDNYAINFPDSNTDLADFIGKALVLHANADDLGQGGNAESLVTGNAGPRLGCCIVNMNEFPQAIDRLMNNGWVLRREGKALRRAFMLGDFNEAFGFLTRVALKAEKMGASPSFQISSNSVIVTITAPYPWDFARDDLGLANFANSI